MKIKIMIITQYPWNGSNFSSGDYYYQLSVNGNLFETKKNVSYKVVEVVKLVE